jgi:peptidoglycan/xylan/chitin deacetylase (PgdA/CDA1 family)
MENGKFIISLDFELHWGVAELWNAQTKEVYYRATRKSIPLVLNLFEKYQIHATWATVGFLFAKNKKQLLKFLPTERPTYKNENLNYYKLIDADEIGHDESDDPYHYGYSLINNIINTPNQELATHTFCHYYCNEVGQNLKQFNADLQAAQNIAKENFNIELKSLVYPRNQFNAEYLSIAQKNGIKVVRSNPDVWFWKRNTKFSPLARAFDTLMPISAPLSYSKKEIKVQHQVLLLPASRFLRPYINQEKILQRIKLKRILNEMTHAAKNNKVYHLWWHPHNFGYATDENLDYLETILKHYIELNKAFSFTSKSMLEMY